MVRDEPQQVALRVRRHRRPHDRAAVARRRGQVRPQGTKTLQERVAVRDRRARDLGRVGLAAQRRVDVDVLFERERRVEHGLDTVRAVRLDRGGDLPRVGRRLLDDVLAHLRGTAPEQQVVGGKISVPEHVCDDEQVLGVAVVAPEVGVTRVAREHDLEQPRQAEPVLHQPVDVAHAERPVRHAHRQPVDRDFHHQAVRHRLEVDRQVVEALGARQALELVQVRAPAVGHAGPPQLAACSRPKKCRTAAQMSSGRSARNAPTARPRAARRRNR